MTVNFSPSHVFYSKQSLNHNSLSVYLQSYFAACEDETPAIRNHDRVLQRLCEHIDHALLYGLQDISSGYWVLVLHFTRREAVRQMDELQHIATNLGRSRAWLYLALNESSLESYLRLFQENQSLLHKYYFKNALVCSHDHLALFLTLVSGLEFISFDLEMDVPYLDVAPYMPEYYKPHNLLDFEERLHSSDSLSLHSFTSLTSTNLEWDDSAIAPSSEGHGFDPQTVVSDTVVVSSDSVKAKVATRLSPHSPTFRHNPFNGDSDTNTTNTSADVTPVHVAGRHDSTVGDEMENGGNVLEVIRYSSYSLAFRLVDTEAKLRRNRAASEVVNREEDREEALLRLPEMKDSSMDTVGQPLCDVMDRLNGATVSPSSPNPDALQASPASTDVHCFTTFSPDATSSGGGHNDLAEHGQSQTLSSGLKGEGEAKAAAGQESDVKTWEQDAEAGQETERNLLDEVKEKQEDKLSPSESSHPAEFMVDNNHLLLLMIHVFRENEEQLFKMLKMSTGHMEGDLQPLYLLLTDCYIYLLRKGAADKPYNVEDAVSYNELDYLSVGLDQQTVTVVCINRRRKFLLDTADASLTLWFLSILKSAMVKGCREPPYPSILTDATMEKLSLTKFVSQESQCEVSEVSLRLYSLVHWEDPLDMMQGCSPTSGVSFSTKEGTLQYRSGTTYLGKELWKSCYLVLSSGILYLYAERTDVTPLLSVSMGGEHCGGCRRSNSTERPHAFQVILTERPPLELSANDEQDMAEWMQLLCQSVSKGVIPQGVAPTPCIPCCLVVTDRKLLTCHQDCQTSFFRSLGCVDICDITAVMVEANKQYCVIEFASDRAQFLPTWVLYFSGCRERDRLLEALGDTWKAIFQVDLPHKEVVDLTLQKRCSEALALMSNSWQRADSLARGRAQREPWC
uniref:Pleckstrin homology domain-containing family M member 2 n=1 Tax=Takifugu rubripes TaxID=31033 RepID=A0A674MS33_TAKRU